MIQMGTEVSGSRKKVEQRLGRRAISMRRTRMSYLTAAEAKRMYFCLHSRVGSDISNRESCECKGCRFLQPAISITPSGSVLGATSPTTNKQSCVDPVTNFDPLLHNYPAMSANTQAEAPDLHHAQQMWISFSPWTSTPEIQHVSRTIPCG